MKIHLDTDLGGDIDDLCALAMVLRWSPDVQVTGITVVGDTAGRRTGCVRYALGLEWASDIPVAAGAETSGGFYRWELGLPPEERYWPEPVAPSPNPLDNALYLLKNSIEQGAVIAAIGPYTNLCLLDQRYPGILAQASLFLMGGYIYPPRPGYPQWGNEMDFNIQADLRSARYVLEHSHPTLVPLAVTVETALRRADLPALRRCGALGELIARQADAFAQDEQAAARFGPTCPALPRDIINFQHDPLACAVALGWREGVTIEEIPLRVEEKDGWLTETVDPTGKPFRVVTQVDGPRFNALWLDKMGSG